MARTFRRQQRAQPISDINITPLMDLAFSLLIIFMVSTPLLEQSVPVDLPQESVRPQTRSPDEAYQVINVDADGIVYWGDEPVEEQTLRGRLMELAAQPEPPILRIRADASLRYQRVIDVMDAVKNANLTKISLETRAR